MQKAMWIVKTTRKYPKSGDEYNLYFRGIVMGLMVELTENIFEAKKFATKKSAQDYMRQTGHTDWQYDKIGS